MSIGFAVDASGVTTEQRASVEPLTIADALFAQGTMTEGEGQASVLILAAVVDELLGTARPYYGAALAEHLGTRALPRETRSAIFGALVETCRDARDGRVDQVSAAEHVLLLLAVLVMDNPPL